jgi:hypothetical protein
MLTTISSSLMIILQIGGSLPTLQIRTQKGALKNKPIITGNESAWGQVILAPTLGRSHTLSFILSSGCSLGSTSTHQEPM